MNSLKLGIGVCSYRRPHAATITCRSILDTLAFPDAQVITLCSVDEENPLAYEWVAQNFGLISAPNAGVAANKNRLLRHFLAQECDLIFIIEDDVVMQQPGWLQLYISALAQTGWGHINWLVPEFRSPITERIPLSGLTIEIYGHEVSGVFMVISRQCLKQVGRFDEAFGRYGCEHVDYSRRCFHAGLYPNRHPHIVEAHDILTLAHCEPTIPRAELDHHLRKSLDLLVQRERARMNGQAGYYLPL